MMMMKMKTTVRSAPDGSDKDTFQDIDEMFSTLRAASVIGDIGFQR